MTLPECEALDIRSLDTWLGGNMWQDAWLDRERAAWMYNDGEDGRDEVEWKRTTLGSPEDEIKDDTMTSWHGSQEHTKVLGCSRNTCPVSVGASSRQDSQSSRHEHHWVRLGYASEVPTTALATRSVPRQCLGCKTMRPIEYSRPAVRGPGGRVGSGWSGLVRVVQRVVQRRGSDSNDRICLLDAAFFSVSDVCNREVLTCESLLFFIISAGSSATKAREAESKYERLAQLAVVQLSRL